MPETKVLGEIFGVRGDLPETSSLKVRMWGAVVPQQPPTRFNQPSSIKRAMAREIICGVSRYFPFSSGSPALGTQATLNFVIPERVRRWSVMNSGPVAQFKPT